MSRAPTLQSESEALKRIFEHNKKIIIENEKKKIILFFSDNKVVADVTISIYQ